MFPGRIRPFHLPLLCVLIPCLGSSGRLAAQTTGILEGRVLDPSGSVVPEAVIKIVHLHTGMFRHLTSDARGRYQAYSLPPGPYRIEASHPGFRGEIRQPIDLPAGGVVQVDFHLLLGEPQERVVVNAEMPLLSTATSDWGGSIARQKLEDFPLKGRDMFDLAVQTPGAAIALTAKTDLNYGFGIHLSVNGSRPNQNGFRLDGIYINDAAAAAPSSAAGALLGIEGVSELRIVSSPFSAEYGRSAGAVITAVSKPGSNEYHGSLYEFFRNSRLDARNFFDPAGEKTPPLRKNHFGASLGGPICANSLFFFSNYEGIRSTSSKTQKSSTMTEDARKGILPTSVIPVAPAVQPYLELYPLPNGRDFGDGTAEFLSGVATRTREDLATARVDSHFSERFRSFGRYTFDNASSSTSDPFLIWTFPSSSRYQFFQADGQYLPSPSSIHSFRLGFSRVRNSDTTEVRSDIPASLSFVPGQTLGVIDVAGLTSLGGLKARLRPRQFVINDYQINYDGTRIIGSHALRFGFSLDRIQFNQRTDENPIGRYSFSSLADFLQAKTNYGDMMLPGSDSIRGWRQNQFAAFVQDEYRITAHLSATLGVRYERYTTPSEVNGKIATLPDPLHDSGVTIGGPLFENPSAKNFAPRGAIAWDPFGRGKTVLRAGAGIFYDLLGTREVSAAGARMPPFFTRIAMQRPAFPNLLEAARNAKPEVVPNGIDFRPNQPYAIQYQLSIEQRTAASMVIRLTYAGNRGVHLPGQVGNLNPPAPDVLDDGNLFFPEGGPRLNPAFGRIIMRLMEFNSFHNAFHAELQRRWSNRWGFQVKYTWSKTIDEISSVAFTDFVTSDQMPNVFSFRQNRGVADFDLRHQFAANFSYRLPDWDAPFRKQVFGGWEIHGLIQAQTGYPFSPFVGFDRARVNPGSDDLGQRPDLVAIPGMKLILGDPLKYFNDMAFALPAAGRLGNLGRNALTGPGLFILDLAIHKDLWRTERHAVRLRLEVFNVPNHPNFQVPSGLALFNSSLRRLGTAGRITSTSTPSRQIQIALKWNF